MLKLLHAADLHLDAPFASLPAELARERRAEQRLLLDRLAETANRREADLVLLAGDLLDAGQTYRETVQALAAALGKIRAPVFIAPGNHDYYTSHSLYASSLWPENVHIFRSQAVERVELPDCVLYGWAFTGQYREDFPLRGFHAEAGDKPAVMVCHGDMSGAGRYGPITQEDVAHSGLTYLALGHVHGCSGLQWAGETAWAYPGCTQGRGFDELGEKGALWVTIDRERGVEAEFLPLCQRKYTVLTCDLTGKDPSAALRETLAGDQEDITRLILTGEAQGLDLTALTKLAGTLRWWVSLRDQTKTPRDIWSRREEDSLTGLFLRRMWEKLSAASEEEREVLEKAVRFGLAALENGEDMP